jgi:hypothetical protein
MKMKLTPTQIEMLIHICSLWHKWYELEVELTDTSLSLFRGDFGERSQSLSGKTACWKSFPGMNIKQSKSKEFLQKNYNRGQRKLL